MDSLNQVSIELQVKGQQEVQRAFKNLEKAQDGLNRGIKVSVDVSNKNAKSLDRIAREAAKAQREMDRLDKFVRKGTITQNQFGAETQRLARDLKKLGMANAKSELMKYGYALNQARDGSVMLSNATVKATATNDQFENQVRQTTAAVNAQATAQKFYGRNVSRAGVLTQQAGYQVGDFLVQVQGGTNAFVALGQQATQIAGTLTLLGGKWILLGSALGITIPLLTAVGAAMQRTREETTKTAFDFQRFFTDVKDSLEPLSPVFTSISNAASNVGQAFMSMANLAASNLDTILVAAGSIATLMLAQMIPSIIAATKAMVAFTVATLSNPIVLGATAIAATVALIYELSKSLGSVGESLELLGMAFIEVFKFDSLYYGIRSLNARIVQGILSLVAQLGGVAVRLLDVLMWPFNQLGAVAVGTWEGIKEAWNTVPEFFDKLGADAANFFITGMENLANGAVNALQKVVNGLNAVLSFVGADKAAELFGFSGVIPDIPEADLSKYKRQVEASATEAGQAFSNGFARGYNNSVAEKPIVDTLNDLVSQADSAAVSMGNIADAFGSSFIEANPKIEEIIKRIKEGQSEVDDLAKYFKEVEEKAKGAGSAGSKAGKDIEEAMKTAQDVFDDAFVTAQEFEIQLAEGLVSGIQSVGNAWADFVMRGFSDFKSFADAVFAQFKNLIAQMIATAASNQIMISLGLTGGGNLGGGAGGNLGGGGGGAITGIGSGLTAALTTGGSLMGVTGLAGGFGAGVGMAGSALAGGGISGMTTAIGAQVGAATTAGASMASIGAAVGAVAAPILAIAAVISLASGFFKKKTTQVDQGLDIAIRETEAFVETFQTLRRKSRFGKSSYSRPTAAAPAEVADPIVESINEIQSSIMDAAATMGIASSAFDGFTYDFSLSLKGLTEQEQIQKITEELNKMGDEFSVLSGHFETMNELLEAANQRMQLQNRLDQLLGNNAAILARQREAELAAMNQLNRPLAQAIYQLEDAQSAVQNAQSVAQAALSSLRASIDRVVSDLRDKLSVANEAVNRSRSIFNQLQSALSSRSLTQNITQAFSRREGALNFLRGGDFSDENTLNEALRVVGEPTENLFGSFVDYARDFSRTSNVIYEAKDVAKRQLNSDEIQIQLLERQIESVEGQYTVMLNQYNALLGIDTSVKSVGAAVASLRGALAGISAAQSASKAAAQSASRVASGGISSNQSFAERFGIDEKSAKGSDLARLRGSSQLLVAARMLGVATSGKTGAQIQQELTNASRMAIRMDNATRAKKFAMGGFHTGGMRIVGEQGPELEATGPSRIYSHRKTAEMFKDPELVNEVRALRSEVSGLRRENTELQASNNKYTKRSYDLYRKWDIEGVPAERA